MPSEPPDPRTADAGRFELTHWSLIADAGDRDATKARQALERLCAAYWYPLYAFVRREGHSAHDAQDLTQEFFARLVEKNWLEAVDREKGKFRSFLLAAMKHFLANEWDRARAQKRGGGIALISMDDADADLRYQREPALQITAEQLFDRRWALTLLDQVLERMRREMTDAGKAAQFDALRFCLTGEKAAPYDEIARRLGTTEGSVKVAVHRLRERYRFLLRDEIANTVGSAADVEEELRQLFSALSM